MGTLTSQTTTHLRGLSASEWATDNRVLQSYEVTINSDDGRRKQGDGATAWSSLPYLDTPTNAATQLGWATGAGGAVTQATSKSTGATLSKPVGQVTMNAASLAAATIVSFDLTNTLVAAGDVIVANHVSGGTLGSYTVNARAGAGKITFDVRNNTGGALAEAIVIGFAVIKGAVA